MTEQEVTHPESAVDLEPEVGAPGGSHGVGDDYADRQDDYKCHR